MEDSQTDLPEGWRPSAGDSITGKVFSLERGWSDYQGEFYPIVTIEQSDGKRVNVHAFHAVLKNRLAAVRPGIGDTLTITYHGQRDSKDGRRRVSIYSVNTDKPQDAEAFWGNAPSIQDKPPTGTVAPDIPIEDEGLPF